MILELGDQGKYFQIKYPFNFVLTKIYLRKSGGCEFARGPKTLYGINGTTWVLVETITTAITTNIIYSYTVSNTTHYLLRIKLLVEIILQHLVV
jgi:hypothetical protein